MPALSILFRLNDPDAPPAAQYEAGLALIDGAERLGLDAAWITSHHFGSDKGSIASPLLFLAAASQRTRRIRLGAGVVVLTLEQPLRVAEDAALTAALSGDRLELGLGSGLEPWAFPTFGVDWRDRHTLFAAKLAELRRALAGEELAGGRRLHPPAPQLLSRIWRIAADPVDAARIAAAGDHLILGASKQLTAAENRDRQFAAIRAFRRGAGPAQKIALSRAIFAGRNGEEARARFAAAVPEGARNRPGGEEAGLIGDPGELRARIAGDALFAQVDEVLAQVTPAKLPVSAWLPSLQLLRSEVFAPLAAPTATPFARIA